MVETTYIHYWFQQIYLSLVLKGVGWLECLCPVIIFVWNCTSLFLCCRAMTRTVPGQVCHSFYLPPTRSSSLRRERTLNQATKWSMLLALLISFVSFVQCPVNANVRPTVRHVLSFAVLTDEISFMSDTMPDENFQVKITKNRSFIMKTLKHFSLNRNQMLVI